MSDAHRAYYSRIYPAIWRDKVRRYGFTDYHKRLIAFLRAALPPGRARILEVAVGLGEPFAKALAEGNDFCGIDIARESLLSARRTVPSGRFVEGDAERLPFQSGRFDLVYCVQSSWCLRDVWALVREMARVAAPGGVCVVDLMNAASPRVALDVGAMRLRALLRRGLSGYVRQRACRPWAVLRAASAFSVEATLLRADDLRRSARPWRDAARARLVLVFRVSRAPGA